MPDDKWKIQFNEGQDAYNAGLDIDDNPYVYEPGEDIKRLRWERGWVEAYSENNRKIDNVENLNKEIDIETSNG